MNTIFTPTHKPAKTTMPTTLHNVPVNWDKAKMDLLTYKEHDYWYVGKMSYRSLLSILGDVTAYLSTLTGRYVSYKIYVDYVKFSIS